MSLCDTFFFSRILDRALQWSQHRMKIARLAHIYHFAHHTLEMFTSLNSLTHSQSPHIIRLNLTFSTLFKRVRIHWIDMMWCVVLFQIMRYRDAKSSGIFNLMTPGKQANKHLRALLKFVMILFGILQYMACKKKWKSIKISNRWKSSYKHWFDWNSFQFNQKWRRRRKTKANVKF